MTAISALLLAAIVATTPASDSKPFAACRTAADAVHKEGCTWRSGSLFAVNGWYSTRIAFRDGRPGAYVIYQPGAPEPSEFIPMQARAVPLHIGDMSAIDGDYLVCPLAPRPDPTDPTENLETACLAGAKHLRAGTVAWAFSEASGAGRVRRSR
ncbi:hypothetical protein [Sphingomonas guangdongensis]|uniref:hypothetical protein n=1 Tax=Sphingomonas guangdongensis TaxID=1141890 RepID=UPI001181AA5F|nr:hypothetical protein [Sphingomonas guangdongensis]